MSISHVRVPVCTVCTMYPGDTLPKADPMHESDLIMHPVIEALDVIDGIKWKLVFQRTN
jgi:hypothetical protein